jgi:hypothetical protein
MEQAIQQISKFSYFLSRTNPRRFGSTYDLRRLKCVNLKLLPDFFGPLHAKGKSREAIAHQTEELNIG